MEIFEQEKPQIECKLYKRRWLMILLFAMYNFICYLRWDQYTVISDQIIKYYGVSDNEVKWTADIYTMFYIILALPAFFLRTTLLRGIKYVIIVSCLGIVLSDLLLLYSVHPDRFTLVMIAQGFASLSTLLTVGIIGPFTTTWCGDKEIVIANSIIATGEQLGIVFSFFLPPEIVRNESIDIIGIGLWNIHSVISICSVVTLFFLIIFLQEKPEKPPSLSKVKIKMKKLEIVKDMANVIKNRSFWFLTLIYGLCRGSFVAIIDLLDEVISLNFKDNWSITTVHIGNIGPMILISFILMLLIIANVYDRTRSFKKSTVVLTFCACNIILIFIWSLKSTKILFVYWSAFLIWFIILSYYSVGVEIALKLTHPNSAEITISLTSLAWQLLELFCIEVYKKALGVYGDYMSNLGILIFCILSLLFVVLIPTQSKRKHKDTVIKEQHLLKTSTL